MAFGSHYNSNPIRSFVPKVPGQLTPVKHGTDSVGDFASSVAKGLGKGILGPSFNPNINIDVSLGGRGNGGKKSTSLKSKPKGKDGSNGGSGKGRGGRPYQPKNKGGYKGDSTGYSPRKVGSEVISPIPFSDSSTLVLRRRDGDDSYSPLYMLNGEFFPEPGKSETNYSMYEKLLGNQIYKDYCDVVASSKGTYLTKKFPKDRFYKYINSVSRALQVYYCIDSILSYTSNPENQNKGLEDLRFRFNADIISKYDLLARSLSQFHLNPRIVQFIRYMYQNFSFSGADDAPIIRLGYDRLFRYELDVCLDGSLESNFIDDITRKLYDDVDINSIMGQCFPQWSLSELPPSFNGVIYDKSFLDFWHNCNIASEIKDDQTDYSISVSSPTQEIKYNVISDELNGHMYSLFSAFSMRGEERDSVLELGVWKPSDDFSNFSFLNKTSLSCAFEGEMVGCTSESVAAGSGILRVPIMQVDYYGQQIGFALKRYHLPGSRRLQYHSLANVQQPLANLVGYLFDVEGV